MYTEGSKLGRFEGCESEVVGMVLYQLVGISGYDEECGDVNNGRWYALIHGKRYSFIITECDQGFVDYDVYDDKDQALADWALIESTVYDQDDDEHGTCPACDGELVEMGVLGFTIWYRCRQCGSDVKHSMSG